jgi:hypothetical protein
MSNSAITFGPSAVKSNQITWSEQIAFRNKIMNGNFDIWQRGTADTALSQGYRADRWGHNQFQDGLVTQQPLVVSGEHPGNSRFVARISGDATANTSRLSLDQGIELANTISLRGKTITASFYVRFSAASLSATVNWNAELGYSNSSNDGSFTAIDYTETDVSRLSIFNGNYPTTWKKYTISIPVGLSAQNVALRFRFNDLTDRSTSDWYEVSQVQVEEGTIATPFEQRPIGTELLLCQRYFEKSYDLSVVPGTGLSYNGRVVSVYSTTDLVLPGTRWKVSKRIPPAVVVYSTSTGATATVRRYNGSLDTAITAAATQAGTEGVDYLAGTFTSNASYDWHYTANAEL